MSNTVLYTREEVKKHNDTDSIWVVMDNNVYDLTGFLREHPGGEEVLLDRAGGDGTDCFDSIGHSLDAKARRELYKIGEIVPAQHLKKVVSGPSTSPEDSFEYEPKATKKSLLLDYLLPASVILISIYYFFMM